VEVRRSRWSDQPGQKVNFWKNIRFEVLWTRLKDWKGWKAKQSH
jgi:hypothetical protein